MGEYADYMLNGDDCQQCGQHIGNGPGFPRSCRTCVPATERALPSARAFVSPIYLTRLAKAQAKKARRRARDIATQEPVA